MVRSIVNTFQMHRFLISVLKGFEQGDLLEIENGKLQCVFDQVEIKHESNGAFEYSIEQLQELNTMVSLMRLKPLNIEFHEKTIKISI